MKVLQVVHSFPPRNMAGTEVYTYNLSKELSKNHRVSVFHRVEDLDAEEYELKSNKLGGLTVFTVNNTYRLCDSFKTTYKNCVIQERFRALLDKFEPDIVHIQHLLHLGTGIIDESKKRNLPVIFTLHDYWLVCPNLQLLKGDLSVCDGKDDECSGCATRELAIKKDVFRACHFLKRLLSASSFQFTKGVYLAFAAAIFLTKDRARALIAERSDYIKETISKVDLFTSPSKFLREIFIDFGIPDDKVVFLSNSSRLDGFADLDKRASNKIRFGFIGSAQPAKGLDILIRSFRKIKKDDIELKIYGRGISPKEIPAKNIKFMGAFDNKDVARIFAEIDILVVPSIWNENSPLVIQEAFASKTPVIASNVGGIPELIKDGVNGFLCKPCDVDGLYRKINLIIENPHLIEDLRQNIYPPKDIEENAEEIENIYEDLLGRVKHRSE